MLHQRRTVTLGNIIFPQWSRDLGVASRLRPVLAVASAAACGSLVEVTLRPIVVIRKCPIPRGKEDSQANVVCMFEFVNDGHWKEIIP